MAQTAAAIPWHQATQLWDELRTGELSLSMFAADLHDVVMQGGRRSALGRDTVEGRGARATTLRDRSVEVREAARRLAQG